jgi:hypothetical protein
MKTENEILDEYWNRTGNLRNNVLMAMDVYRNQSVPTIFVQLTLYAFLYNPMIHESGYITVSIHRTREGAEKAMEWHKHSEEIEWNELMGKDIKEFPFGTNQSWKVEIIEVQE